VLVLAVTPEITASFVAVAEAAPARSVTTGEP
jgi:hypothetical protein